MTADQLAKAEALQKLDVAKEIVSEANTWAKDAGIALNSFVSTLTDQTIRISEAPVGRYAMFIIAWKVMAKDILEMGNLIVGYLVGIPFLVVGLMVCVWSYRRQCMQRRVVIEKSPGFWIWREKKYQVIDPGARGSSLSQEDWVTTHAVAAILVVGVASLMIFA